MKNEIGRHTKRLLYITLFLVLVVILAVYAAFIPTYRNWEEVKQISQQLLTVEDAPSQIALLNEQIGLYDQLTGQTLLDVKQEEIVNAVSDYITNEDQIELCSLPPIHLFEDKDYKIETFTIELQGTFHQLVKYLNYFEMNRSIGKFSSAQFFIQRNQLTRSKELHLKLYIQSFSKKSPSDE